MTNPKIQPNEATSRNPAALLRQEIARRANSPMVNMAGLGPVLALLDAYIAQQELERAHLRTLGAIMLRRHFGRSDVTTEQLQTLQELANG